MYKIGIDIGGSFTKVGIFASEKMVKHMVIPTDTESDAKTFLSSVASQVFDAAKELNINHRFLFLLGICCPGTILENKGICVYSPNLKWRNVDLIKPFKEFFKCEIKVSHDAKSSALAELTYGELKGVRYGLYITLGTGFGSAFIIDGKVERGRDVVSELGHMLYKKGGRLCPCGRQGCVDMYVSAKGILINAQEKNENYSDVNINEIFKQEKENAEYGEIVNEFLEDLSEVIVNLINAFHPEKIVLGGGVAHLIENKMKVLSQKVRSKNIYPTKTIATIRVGKFLNDAGIMGATLL